MSPKARDRARAKRRYDKRQTQLAQQAAQRRRTQQVVGAVVAVVLVAGGAAGLTRSLGRTSSSSASPTSAGSPARSQPTTAASDASNPCKAPGPKPAEPESYPSAPARTLAGGKVVKAVIHTTCGDVGVDLYGDKAPQTVSSFVFLSGKKFFDSTPCHRLTTQGIYVLQCGDPTGTGTGGPGYTFGVENAPADGRYPAGTLAMARSTDPNSNGSQFFLTYQNTQLPTDGGGYTIFGKVTSGLSVLRTVADGGVADGQSDGAPARAVSISSVTVTQ